MFTMISSKRIKYWRALASDVRYKSFTVAAVSYISEGDSKRPEWRPEEKQQRQKEHR